MKRYKLSYLLVFIIVVFAAINGCKKEEGCMQNGAINYDADAEKDDGSCLFTGNIVFWFDSTRMEYYRSQNASPPIAVLVNGTSVGELNHNLWNTEAPECGDLAAWAIYYSHSMSSSTGKLEVAFEDADGTSFGSATVTVIANECVDQLF